MNALKAVWAELIGLFADDGNMAAPILIWIAACGALLPRLGLPSALPPLILFIGLTLILARSVWTRARR